MVGRSADSSETVDRTRQHVTEQLDSNRRPEMRMHSKASDRPEMDWRILSALDPSQVDLSDQGQWKADHLARMISACDLHQDFVSIDFLSFLLHPSNPAHFIRQFSLLKKLIRIC
jgi:hypothetical protein